MKNIASLLSLFFVLTSFALSAQSTPVGLWKTIDDETGDAKSYVRIFEKDGKLYGNVLCEGAQGFWLDINQGNYPYVTSSNTLPYSACSLGFPPQCIRHIYGASKIYDTRSGIDPLFPESLLDDIELLSLVDIGEEYGTTTGRKRKTNWLNLDKLIYAIQISGTTTIIISKIDVVKLLDLYKLIHNNTLIIFETFIEMKNYIIDNLKNCSPFLQHIYFSDETEIKKLEIIFYSIVI